MKSMMDSWYLPNEMNGALYLRKIDNPMPQNACMTLSSRQNTNLNLDSKRFIFDIFWEKAHSRIIFDDGAIPPNHPHPVYGIPLGCYELYLYVCITIV